MSPLAERFLIKAYAFRCLEESNEWSSHDEPYWLFAVVGPGYKAVSSTHVFNGVDAGEAFYFGANEGCIFGANCQPAKFPAGEVGAIITCMEHDEGDISDTRDAFATAVGIADGVLAASGVAAWVAAVVAALGGLIAILLGFLEDDHVVDFAYTWDAPTLHEVLDKHGGTYDVVSEGGSSSEGRYRLRTRVTRMV